MYLMEDGSLMRAILCTPIVPAPSLMKVLTAKLMGDWIEIIWSGDGNQMIVTFQGTSFLFFHLSPFYLFVAHIRLVYFDWIWWENKWSCENVGSWCGPFFRFNAFKMLELIRGKRLVFVGDSINRNQWESLLCLLRGAITDPKKVYEIHGRRITKERGDYSFKFVVLLLKLLLFLFLLVWNFASFDSWCGFGRIIIVLLSTMWPISWFMRVRRGWGRSGCRHWE